MLLDKLKLHLLVLSEDLTYHFKYLQVMKGKVGAILDDGDGNIDKAKFDFFFFCFCYGFTDWYQLNTQNRFIHWWGMGMEEMLKLIEADEANDEDEAENHVGSH